MSGAEYSLRVFRAWVAYDGTDFSGFQEQNGQATIQAALKASIANLTQHPYRLTFAGRTDAGVHARAQALCIEMHTSLDQGKLVLALSHGLPKSIRIFRIDEMPFSFNPKRHAIGKRYVYRVWNALASNPFEDRYMWHVRRNIDVSKMADASQALVGDHDYESFRSAQCVASHARRYIWKVDVKKNRPRH